MTTLDRLNELVEAERAGVETRHLTSIEAWERLVKALDLPPQAT